MPSVDELKERLNYLTVGRRIQNQEHLREILSTSQLLGTMMAQRTQPIRHESVLVSPHENYLHHLKRLKMYMAE